MPAAIPAIIRQPLITVLSRPAYTEPPHLPVSRHGASTDAERLVEFAGRLRFMSQQNAAARSTSEYVESLKTQGDGEVLEHATFSLLLEGVSRTLARELARDHAGIASSERAARSVDEEDVAFVMPPALLGDAALERVWTDAVTATVAAYRTLVDGAMARHGWIGDKTMRRRIARDAAQGVLPGSVETKLILTGNARAWRTLLARCAGADAEVEMRRLAIAVLRVLQHEAPALFSDLEVYQAADRWDAARLLRHPA